MELKPEMQDLVIGAPLGGLMLEPDSQIIERPGWYQILTPSVRDPSLNEVILSRIEVREADERVEEVFSQYRQIGTEFKWSIGPMSNAAAIEPIISGHALDSWSFRGMFIDTKSKVDAAAGLQVERVQRENFSEFIDVYLSGWGLENFRKAAEEKFSAVTEPDGSQRYFLVKKAGTPIASAGTILKDDCGYLVGAVVLPEFRGSGAYRALLQSRLEDLQACRRTYAVTHAREATAAPILAKLGFQTAFQARIYKLK
jgi:hypothetical protein